MRRPLALFGLSLCLLALAPTAFAQGQSSAATPAPAFSAPAPAAPADLDPAAFDAAMRAWLAKHPDVVYQAVVKATGGAGAADSPDAAAKKDPISEAKSAFDRFIAPGKAPIAGPADAKIYLIELFDLKCHYCKVMEKNLEPVRAKYPNIRFVSLDFPVLGQDSVRAAHLALAAIRQGKYAEYRAALLAREGALDDATLQAAADEVGLDWDRLNRDATADDISAELDRIQALAKEVGIGGTPFVMVGTSKADAQAWSGAIDSSELSKAIDKLQSPAK